MLWSYRQIYLTTCKYGESVYTSTTYKGNETKEGDIRLVGGRHLWEGRVEIFLSGVWGTISDDGPSNTGGPSNTAAAVVCRQLGYKTKSKEYTP